MFSSWPQPEYNNNDQPHFLFILTPPNSGSTAIAELLNSSPNSMVLTPIGEGQHILPDMHDRPERWDKKIFVDYKSVKAVWLNTYQQVNTLVKNIRIRKYVILSRISAH